VWISWLEHEENGVQSWLKINPLLGFCTFFLSLSICRSSHRTTPPSACLSPAPPQATSPTTCQPPGATGAPFLSPVELFLPLPAAVTPVDSSHHFSHHHLHLLHVKPVTKAPSPL